MCFNFFCLFLHVNWGNGKVSVMYGFHFQIIMCFVPGSSADSYKTLILLLQLAVNLLRSNLYTVVIQARINFDFYTCK